MPSIPRCHLLTSVMREPEIIDKYFCPLIVQKTEGDKLAHRQESIKKLQNSKTIKDIFNTFKC